MREIFLLGASDPEMAEVKRLVEAAGYQAVQALAADGRPVHPGNAYQASLGRSLEAAGVALDAASFADLVLVECDCAGLLLPRARRVDHHRPGDPGYGLPPDQFWRGSSLGQVCDLLRVEPTPHLMMMAAADHCLGHAYRGLCPGVDPDALMRWRVESRAEFQKRPVEAVMADVKAAMDRIMDAKQLPLAPCDCGVWDDADFCSCETWGAGSLWVSDLRGETVPELPEAAVRLGMPVLAGPLSDPSGRRKFVLQAADPDTVRAWLDGGGPVDVVDRYGDPERGFAGGYSD